MNRKKITVGSRDSLLARMQSMTVVDFINRNVSDVEAELLTMKTTGDKILDRTLDKVGGKGLFVKELDLALQDGRSDLSVHSLKDVPMELDPSLPLVAFSKREDPRDVLVLPEGQTEPDPALPIGSSSLRRVLQLKKLFPGYRIEPVRGNLQTRLRKLDEGQYGALVLAAAGLKRLDLAGRISRYFTVDEIIPAAGQGIIAVQARAGEDVSFLEGYADQKAALAALCERAYVRTLNGGCTSPVCAHAEITNDTIFLRALYYDDATGRFLTGEAEGSTDAPEALGERLAKELKDALTNEIKGERDNMSGKVWLVGAGPGDAGLFTLKGQRVLKEADVVVYDALVGQGILSMIPDSAELIFAGKRSGNHFLKQEETNQVLLEEAQKGKKVVRLKGGDPFLFGRGGEELELLVQHGIPFEIVPGVTSAFAVPAYNGIPVTHRDFCSSVHVITGHKRADHSYDIDFEALVHTKGTLVFLMGIAALSDICRGLLDAGMDPATPATVLEQGTTAAQHRIEGTLGTLSEICSRTEVKTPAIIVVGKVCALAEEFSWYEKQPLGGVKVAVTRPKELVSQLSSLLRKEGAEVLEIPAIAVKPVADETPLKEAIEKIREGGFDWLVFTSPSGVRIFMEALLKEADIRSLAGVKIASIGKGSEKALNGFGLHADFIPSVYDGATLGKELAAILAPNARILIPRAAIGNPELIAELSRAEDAQITDLATYDTVYESSRVIDVQGQFESGAVDFAVFTSASTVRGFAESLKGADLTGVKAVCIGKQTQKAAEGFGMKTFTAKEATLSALVECVKEAAKVCREV